MTSMKGRKRINRKIAPQEYFSLIRVQPSLAILKRSGEAIRHAIDTPITHEMIPLTSCAFECTAGAAVFAAVCIAAVT